MSDRPRPLPYGRQLIEDDDVAAVAKALKADLLTTGPEVGRFERTLAEKTGAEFAVACSNGTAALHLAALALDLGPGDKAIVPAITFLATANCARYVGADVTFADVDPVTGLMTPETLADAIGRAGPAAKAVLPVHLNGQAVDMTGIARVARTKGLRIVEDACHGIGGEMRAADGRWLPVGGCADADMATFSFHPVKTVAMGEGGAVTTNDKMLADRLALLRNHGMTRDAALFSEKSQAFGADGEPNPWYYEMPEPGFNYRATDFQCALGTSQLGKLARFVAARREIAAMYDEHLAHLAPLVVPVAKVPWSRPALHLYAVQVDFAAARTTRAHVMRALKAEDIGTQVHYLPVNRQPYYRRLYGETALPGADAYYEKALSLPLFVGMTEADVARVALALGRALKS